MSHRVDAQTVCEAKKPAAGAQARVVRAVEQVLSQAPKEQDVAMIGHDGTGTLLYCYLAGVPISRQYDLQSVVNTVTAAAKWYAWPVCG